MPRTKKEQVSDAAKYVLGLRARRKELGWELRHWYIHDLPYAALEKAAARENRKIQQYVALNIWKLIPEDLRPKEIPAESLTMPKQKKVRLHLKIRTKATGREKLVLQDGLIHNGK
jgi:hypothetical protein